MDISYVSEDEFEEGEIQEDDYKEDDELEEGEIFEYDSLPPINLVMNIDAIAADIQRKFPWIQGSGALVNLSWTRAQQHHTKNTAGRHFLEPLAIRFLNSLASPSLNELNTEDRNCAICLAPYFDGEHAEKPLRLPCNHLFGEVCLWHWMSQIGIAANTDCPLCRAKHVERRRSFNTLQGLEELLQQAEYLLSGTSRVQISGEGRMQWQELKDHCCASIRDASQRADREELEKSTPS